MNDCFWCFINGVRNCNDCGNCKKYASVNSYKEIDDAIDIVRAGGID